MDEDQIDRYEAFRRSSLQKASMRKVIACILLLHVIKKPSLHVLKGSACLTSAHANSVHQRRTTMVSHLFHMPSIQLMSLWYMHKEGILGYQMVSGGAAASQRDRAAAAGAPAGGHLRHHQAVCGGSH